MISQMQHVRPLYIDCDLVRQCEPICGKRNRLLSAAFKMAPRIILPSMSRLPGALSVSDKAAIKVTHSLASSTEVNNAWNYISTSPCVVTVCCLNENGNNCDSTFGALFLSLIILKMVQTGTTLNNREPVIFN
jgi:hypothetical protein